MDDPHGLAQFFGGPHLLVGDPQGVVEDDDPRSAGRGGDDLLDLRIVDRLDLV